MALSYETAPLWGAQTRSSLQTRRFSLRGFKMPVGSCCGSVVLVDGAAEAVAALDLVLVRGSAFVGWLGWQERESAVGTLAVVVPGVDA